MQELAEKHVVGLQKKAATQAKRMRTLQLKREAARFERDSGLATAEDATASPPDGEADGEAGKEKAEDDAASLRAEDGEADGEAGKEKTEDDAASLRAEGDAGKDEA